MAGVSLFTAVEADLPWEEARRGGVRNWAEDASEPARQAAERQSLALSDRTEDDFAELREAALAGLGRRKGEHAVVVPGAEVTAAACGDTRACVCPAKHTLAGFAGLTTRAPRPPPQGEGVQVVDLDKRLKRGAVQALMQHVMRPEAGGMPGRLLAVRERLERCGAGAAVLRLAAGSAPPCRHSPAAPRPWQPSPLASCRRCVQGWAAPRARHGALPRHVGDCQDDGGGAERAHAQGHRAAPAGGESSAAARALAC